MSNLNAKKREALIAVRYSVAFSLLSTVTDDSGRFVILVCEVNNVKCMLVNVYLPNVHHLSYIRKIWKKVTKVRQGF